MIEEIELTEGVSAELDGKTVKVSGPEGSITRKFEYPGIKITKTKDKIVLRTEKEKKKMKKIIKTWAAHLHNMVRGVKQKFTYKLKIAASHFPINVEVKDDKILIKNFLGEKKPREARRMKSSEVKVQGEEITVQAVDREVAGQTAANIENATRVKGKDRRIFLDGIYIIEKPGRQIA